MHTEKYDSRDITYACSISDERIARMREANDKRLSKPPRPDRSEYTRRSCLGFYKNFSDIDDDLDGSCLLARKMACIVFPSVVGLSCKNSIDLQQRSSGIVVQHKRIKKILTSTYILGGHSDAMGLKVEILLPSGKIIDGKVSLIDEQHNIVLIHGDLKSVKGTSLSLDIAPLDIDVISLGRNSNFGLMGSRGKVNIRRDALESDDLMSSTCTISESGIGGPLVDISTGSIIGINVFVQKNSTLFMPSIILNHCFQQLLDNGEVIRPCVGLKTRSIGEKKLNELEVIYEKFPFTDGITVNQVIRGSPADEAGISVGDIITLCNDTPVSSPVQLADRLLDIGKSKSDHGGVITCEVKKRVKTIEIQIQRVATGKSECKTIIVNDFTSPVFNSWPAFPFETFASKAVYLSLFGRSAS